MNFFTLHPNVYATGRPNGLIQILEQAWVTELTPGQGTIYLISGFANYNGGVRFYDIFSQHISNGGRVVAIFAGSTSQRLSSRQVVAELVNRGVEVHIVNRKRLLHAKLYGVSSTNGDILVVTSGNFTGPGMALNGEASVLLDTTTTTNMNFSWDDMITSLLNQSWQIHHLNGSDSPGWNLLYDEHATTLQIDDTEKMTMLVTLVHADTVRIQAQSGTTASKGSQYFWLSRDSYGFFPPLTIRNNRGVRATYSCLVNMNYIDLGVAQTDCRITFEAENNLDFRLGTGPLRSTGLATRGDMAAITRIGESDYELRIISQGSEIFNSLDPYAMTHIGHQGKRYGFISNSEFYNIINP